MTSKKTPMNSKSPFADIRGFVRAIQLAVYENGLSGRYHAGKARDLISDTAKSELLTTATDQQEYQKQLPALVERIETLDELSQRTWLASRERNAAFLKIQNQLNEAYDAVQLLPRNYERLVRQSDKPLVAAARHSAALPPNSPARCSIEDQVRMPVGDYLRLENEIDSAVATIDQLRDRFAARYAYFAHECAESMGDGTQISQAAAALGLRLAVNTFDDRHGWDFKKYATCFINRELNRAGVARQAE
jgi:hypothetical protein